jgi:hypothetical protein
LQKNFVGKSERKIEIERLRHKGENIKMRDCNILWESDLWN